MPSGELLKLVVCVFLFYRLMSLSNQLHPIAITNKPSSYVQYIFCNIQQSIFLLILISVIVFVRVCLLSENGLFLCDGGHSLLNLPMLCQVSCKTRYST